MRPLNTLATTLLATILVVGLSACGKKKNGSATPAAAAATPGSACIFNPQIGQYTTTAGLPCNPNATQTTCPAAPNNFFTNQMGQVQTCTPGQVVSNGGGYSYGGQYPNTGNQNQTGCDAYYYQYGVQYVPVVLSGQLQCVRIDLVNQYAQGTSYYNNQDYYYAYPPYEYTGSGYCGSQVAVNFGGFSGSMCF